VRYRAGGKAREAGLGPAIGANAVTLANARALARGIADKVKVGVDPLVERAAAMAAIAAERQLAAVRSKTFKEVSGLYIAAHEKAWRNAKHRAQWASTLREYAYPHFGDVPVSDVGTAHVLAALEPIWTTKTETATRVRGRIESILDYAAAREWRSGANPARWKGHLKNMLAAPSKVAPVEHHAALPWAEVGAFMFALRGRAANSARALEFACLTAVRTSDVLGARWAEIDRENSIWLIPGDRMKSWREHRVPLAVPTLKILSEMEKLRPEDDHDGAAYVFPGSRPGKPLSGMAMLMLLRRMGYGIGDLTVHGFRSTFKDWAGEHTGHANELSEIALAHVVEGKTEAAYRRGDMLEKRRCMMNDWAAFCAQPMVKGDSGSPMRGAA
jgi:integrase